MDRMTLRLTRLEDRAVPAAATWDGGGADSNWSTAANWAGDVAPTPGDDLIFPAGARQLASVNDFPAGTAFRSLILAGLNDQITGNRVALAAGVLGSAPAGGGTDAAPRLGLDLTLTADQALVSAGPAGYVVTGALDLNGHVLLADVRAGAVVLGGTVGGTGGLGKVGPGTLVLTAANTYAGQTDVRDGVLDVRNGAALGAAGAGNETIVHGGTLAFVFPVPFTGQDPITVPESILFGGPGARGPDGQPLFPVRVQEGYFTLTGPLTLLTDLGSGSLAAVVVAHLNIAGAVTESGAAPGNLFLYGNINFTPTATVAVDTIIQAAGITTFDGRMLKGTYTFNPDPAHPGTLGGNGYLSTGVLGPVHVDFAATFSPGYSTPGTLTTGDLTMSGGSTFVADLTTFPVGTATVSRANVHGLVRLTDVKLAVFPDFSLTPAAGDRYRIIDNDGSDPVQGQFNALPEGAIAGAARGVGFRITYHGGDGNDVELIADPAAALAYAVGAGAGGGPQVNLYAADGTLLRSFNAYDSAFRGGVRVALADFNGDGVPDLVTAPGPGGSPDVRVYDGASALNPLFGPFGAGGSGLFREFMAYDAAFTGGVFLALGDVTGDHVPDFITGAGPGGGPHVKVFDGRTTTEAAGFYAYDPGFRGGVTVAAGDVTGDGTAEVITGPGPGGGPHVKAFSLTGSLVAQLLAYDPAFRGGVNVAAADLDGDGRAEVITGPMAGGGPVVRAFAGASLTAPGGAVLAREFLAYDASFTGGVTVGVANLGGSGPVAVLTGTGPGGGPHVRAFVGPSLAPERSFLAFDPAFTGGVFVS